MTAYESITRSTSEEDSIMSFRKAVSLICTLCMLTAMLAPMSALADVHVEEYVTEAQNALEGAEVGSGEGGSVEGRSGESGSGESGSGESGSGESGSGGSGSGGSGSGESGSGGSGSGESGSGESGSGGSGSGESGSGGAASPTAKPAPTAAPAPTDAPPFQFPEILQILTDRQSMWVGDSVVYTIIGVDENCVLGVYDPSMYTELNPENPTLLACTPNYPDPYDTIPRMTWNPVLKGWQFSYTAEKTGQFQLVWRMYSDTSATQYWSYTEASNQDIITVYDLPTIQVYSLESNGKVGDPITLVVNTSKSVTSVTLVDENGRQLDYIESVTSSDMYTYTQWTCVYKFYETGMHRVAAQAKSVLGFTEKTVSTDLFSIGILPSTTPVPLPSGGPTQDPAQPTASLGAGYVRFKQVPSADAKVGGDVTLNLDVEFAAYDGRRINYTEEEFYNYVDYIEIQPEITADAFPFVVDESLQRVIIHSYEEMLDTPFRFDLKVKSDLANGAYTCNFTLRYRLRGNADPEPDKSESGMVFVTGAKTPSSGGGGGGGGGGGSALPPTQAKLMVESLKTDPESPRAGDTFDVILTLKNTNEKQYVQNIKLTYTTDSDVLLPAGGSSSFYIDRIDAGGTCELTIPVTARADMPDAPVKMNLAMEYEDRKVNSLSASQVVVLNVKQVQNLRLDELVLPQDEVVVGDSATFTMNVINAGRTTLYNVSAAMLESEAFMTAGSSYVGNMESGASKQIELDIYPMAEGPIDGTLRVTYEDANGNQSHVDTPFSIYASSPQMDDPGIYEPVIEPTPEPVNEVTDVLSRLPWWVYGAAGLLVICLVMLAALAAHRRRMAAFMDYDDE